MASQESRPVNSSKVRRSRIIYKGPVFGVRRDEVIEPTGVRATREVITHPGSVVIMPVLTTDGSLDSPISLRRAAVFVGAGGWAH